MRIVGSLRRHDAELDGSLNSGREVRFVLHVFDDAHFCGMVAVNITMEHAWLRTWISNIDHITRISKTAAVDRKYTSG